MSFVKKQFSLETEVLVEKFLEDTKYYLEIEASRFPWLEDHIDEEYFVKDLELYIKENQRKYQYKEKQKPFIEKQKQYAKEQRKKAQEFKMSKEPPSKAQISYFNALCKKHKIEKKCEPEKLSKLDLRNAIDELLKISETEEKEKNLNRLNEIISTDKD